MLVLWRIISLCWYILYMLVVKVPQTATPLQRRHIDCVLVQNPPPLPLLAIVHIYCQYIIKYSQGYAPAFIIDWHNLVSLWLIFLFTFVHYYLWGRINPSHCWYTDKPFSFFLKMDFMDQGFTCTWGLALAGRYCILYPIHGSKGS
jgi:hypothetical protein